MRRLVTAAALYTFPAMKPAAAVIGVVPEGTLIRLLVTKGVEAAAKVANNVPVATTAMLLRTTPRRTVATLTID